MKRLRFFSILLFSVIFAIHPWANIAEAIDPTWLRSEYFSIKDEIRTKQNILESQINQAISEEEKFKIVQQSREYIFETLTDKIFPAWHGTSYGFHGISRTPRKGQIACGTFVVYILQDAGFEVPSKMAMQPSENIIKNLVEPSDIKRFWNSASMKRVLGWIWAKGEGLFIVGLDIHVGFLIYKDDKITFCHSSYYPQHRKVVNQDIMEKSPLIDSKYRVIGKILNDSMMIKWLNGEAFPVTYDYFRIR